MIVQFGTSRFLQAHVDLFASEARDAGQDVPGITIVQTTDDPVRVRRLAAFADPAGFPVIVRGLENGAAIERTVRVRSVVGGLQAHADADALRALLAGPATHVVSNTGDVGFEDGAFVAILLAGLSARWQAGGAGLTLLPCELVSRNGDALRAAVLAAAAGRAPAFVAWLDEECRWGNTLVDRIVSAPLEPAGAVAEPYALWAIERQPGLTLPFTHPAVVLTDDLEPFERLKLHILNLGHSWLAERWQTAGARAGATVREALDDRATRAALDALLAQEVIPGFAARGLADEARRYAATTIERFANPFLDHLLSDIHAHHAQKVAKRIDAFTRWVDAAAAHPPAMPQLRALAGRYAAL